MGRPLEVYRQLGLLAGTSDFPGVASFGTVAGPADSTYVLFGLSLPNSALRFQRDGSGFIGEYRVTLTFARDSQRVRRAERREVVRIPSFAETGRTDESVVFQQMVALPPGTYEVEVEAADAFSSRGFRLTDTVEVPRYGVSARRLADPLLVYRADGRLTQEVVPELIANPRRTIPYGGDTPRLYLEAYGVADGHRVSVRVVDERDAELWRSAVVLREGSAEVRTAVVEIPAEPLPLGRLWVETTLEGERSSSRTPMLVTISDQWMVANFEEVLEFLRYIAAPEEVDSLASASPAERRAQWDRFWERRDPVPATPVNEYREQFFERVRVVTEQFGEPGRPGWRTDRGEVFIVLGAPDQVLERMARRADAAAGPSAMMWVYERTGVGRLDLTFEDRTGFGRYELTPASRAAFRAAASRLRPRS